MALTIDEILTRTDILQAKIALHEKYADLRGSVAPKSYAGCVDYVLGRFCKGTDEWLREDTTFETWITSDNAATSLLWLQGRPGSGKTFLGAYVASRVWKKGAPVAFASISKNDDNPFSGTTTLSIIQSLLFELTSRGFKHLRIVCEPRLEGLNSSLDVALEALKAVAASFDQPVLLVVDGVDRVAPEERTRLLQALLGSNFAPTKVHVLISSRAEDDIARVLASVPTICVHHNNRPAIECFISECTDECFRKLQPSADVWEKMLRLLQSLVEACNGSFSYIKEVFQALEGVDYLDEIACVLDEQSQQYQPTDHTLGNQSLAQDLPYRAR